MDQIKVGLFCFVLIVFFSFLWVLHSNTNDSQVYAPQNQNQIESTRFNVTWYLEELPNSQTLNGSIACGNAPGVTTWVCDPAGYIQEEAHGLNKLIQQWVSSSPQPCPCQRCDVDTLYYRIFVVVVQRLSHNKDAVDNIHTIALAAEFLRNKIDSSEGHCDDTAVIIASVEEKTFWASFGKNMKQKLQLHSYCEDKLFSETGNILAENWLGVTLFYFVHELIKAFRNERPCQSAEPTWLNRTLLPTCLALLMAIIVNHYMLSFHRVSMVRVASRRFFKFVFAIPRKTRHLCMRLRQIRAVFRRWRKPPKVPYSMPPCLSHCDLHDELFNRENTDKPQFTQLKMFHVLSPELRLRRLVRRARNRSTLDCRSLRRHADGSETVVLPSASCLIALRWSRLVLRDSCQRMTHNYDQMTRYINATLHRQQSEQLLQVWTNQLYVMKSGTTSASGWTSPFLFPVRHRAYSDRTSHTFSGRTHLYANRSRNNNSRCRGRHQQVSGSDSRHCVSQNGVSLSGFRSSHVESTFIRSTGSSSNRTLNFSSNNNAPNDLQQKFSATYNLKPNMTSNRSFVGWRRSFGFYRNDCDSQTRQWSRNNALMMCVDHNDGLFAQCCSCERFKPINSLRHETLSHMQSTI